VLQRDADGTALLEARPITGRTNQIRIHLWHLGFPINGDAAYLADGEIGETQTLAMGDPPLCLHAWKITFQHPLTKERVMFEAERPAWAHANPRFCCPTAA
jgi:23S rRNA-/tRNA-specific pseudouridylate synthase